MLEVAVEGRIPVPIRGKALLALADLIKGNDANREKFGKSMVSVSIIPEAAGLPNQKPPPGTPTPADTVILQLILEKQPFELRACAAYTFMVSFIRDKAFSCVFSDVNTCFSLISVLFG